MKMSVTIHRRRASMESVVTLKDHSHVNVCQAMKWVQMAELALVRIALSFMSSRAISFSTDEADFREL